MTSVSAESSAVRPLTNHASSARPIAPSTSPARMVSRSGRRRVTKGRDLGAAHQRVGVALERLVENRGADRDQRGAEQRVAEPRPIERAAVGEAETGQRGEQHHDGQARLGQFGEIGGQRQLAARPARDRTKRPGAGVEAGLMAPEEFTRGPFSQVPPAIANANSWRSAARRGRG